MADNNSAIYLCGVWDYENRFSSVDLTGHRLPKIGQGDG
jgi:hypothetical protein